MYKTVYQIPRLLWLSNSPRILVVGYTGATDPIMASNDHKRECCFSIFIVLFIVRLFSPGLKKSKLTTVFCTFCNLCLIVHQVRSFVKPFFRLSKKSFLNTSTHQCSNYNTNVFCCQALKSNKYIYGLISILTRSNSK